MFDSAWLAEQLKDAIELIHEKILVSKPTNKQIWYLLQSYSSMIRDYESFMRAPRGEHLATLQAEVNELKDQVKLLKAQGGIRTVPIGKTGIGGAQ